MPESMTAQDKRWRAESDASTVAEAQAIQSDPTRMRAAKVAGDRMAKEAQKKADALRSVAKKPVPKPTKRKTTARKRSTGGHSLMPI